MAIRAALLEPARSCSAHLDELIKKLREIKVSGCLNIFSYSSGQNEINREAGAEVRALLDQALGLTAGKFRHAAAERAVEPFAVFVKRQRHAVASAPSACRPAVPCPSSEYRPRESARRM